MTIFLYIFKHRYVYAFRAFNKLCFLTMYEIGIQLQPCNHLNVIRSLQIFSSVNILIANWSFITCFASGFVLFNFGHGERFLSNCSAWLCPSLHFLRSKLITFPISYPTPHLTWLRCVKKCQVDQRIQANENSWLFLDWIINMYPLQVLSIVHETCSLLGPRFNNGHIMLRKILTCWLISGVGAIHSLFDTVFSNGDGPEVDKCVKVSCARCLTFVFTWVKLNRISSFIAKFFMSRYLFLATSFSEYRWSLWEQ